MPQGFGDTFVQSLQFGTQIAQRQDEKQQEKQQFATQIALKEKEMQATQVMEGLKMEELVRQTKVQEEIKTNAANYQYDSLYDERMKTLGAQLISVKGDHAFDRVDKISGKQAMNRFQVAGLDPNDELVPKEYFALIKGQEQYRWQLSLEEGKEKAKTDKEDMFFKRMTKLTEDANKNVRGLTKQETIPARTPGLVPGITSQLFNNPNLVPGYSNPFLMMKNLGSAIGGMFDPGQEAGTKQVIDESKLGPAMDKQTEIIQTMEIGLMDKKVTSQLANTYLDPQKSTLLQMADSRLTKDVNGIPIALTNIQGLSTSTIGKIKDILDEIRLRQLTNQTKDLGNQKTTLQVQQLDQKVN